MAPGRRAGCQLCPGRSRPCSSTVRQQQAVASASPLPPGGPSGACLTQPRLWSLLAGGPRAAAAAIQLLGTGAVHRETACRSVAGICFIWHVSHSLPCPLLSLLQNKGTRTFRQGSGVWGGGRSAGSDPSVLHCSIPSPFAQAVVEGLPTWHPEGPPLLPLPGASVLCCPSSGI